jgi:hypothetical protein
MQNQIRYILPVDLIKWRVMLLHVITPCGNPVFRFPVIDLEMVEGSVGALVTSYQQPREK